MLNNLINHYFYNIKKQWNCAGVFLAVLKLYTIKTATIDKELAADKAEVSEIYTKAYTALYRQAVEKQYEIQTQLLDNQISAGKSLNDSLWLASGTANAMLFDSAKANDIVPDILTYLREQSKAEIAAMVASAELYGEFQVSWRSEVVTTYLSTPINGNDNSVRLSATENDIEWAQKVSAARNAYYTALGTVTSEYNNAVIDALEAFNTTMLNVEIARAKAHFNAEESYSKGTHDIETKYAKKQFETNKKNSLAYLDAAITQMVGLAETDAYFARKTADEYGAITVDDDFLAVKNQIDYDNNLAANLKRQEINDSKIIADKAIAKQERRETNNNYVNYFVKGLIQETTYVVATVAADVMYYGTVIIVGIAYDTTVTKAEKTFNEKYCQLTGKYYDALQIIDSGGTIDAEFFENGTSSLNVQVCFPAGTPIILADGSTKNIEDILPGDLVKTVDYQKPDSETIEGNVVRIFQNDPQPLWRLNFGTFEIHATKEHPFYVKGKGWVPAEELQIGDICRSTFDTEIVLVAKKFESEIVPVYNFEVENSHTYFVGENDIKSVLVHNSCWDNLEYASGIAWGGLKGTGQGVLNTVNGLQDIVVSVLNIPATTINGIAHVEEKIGILNSEDSIYVPYIPSPDWSRNVIIEEYGEAGTWSDTHGWSKFVGSDAATTLATLGIGKVTSIIKDINYLDEVFKWDSFADDVVKYLSKPTSPLKSVHGTPTTSDSKAREIGKIISDWLGEYDVITNKAGDTVFLSKDGKRMFRTDFYEKRGEGPHIHIQVFENGKWVDAIPNIPHKIKVTP